MTIAEKQTKEIPDSELFTFPEETTEISTEKPLDRNKELPESEIETEHRIEELKEIIQHSGEDNLPETALDTAEPHGEIPTPIIKPTVLSRIGNAPIISSLISSSERVCDFLSQHDIMYKTERIGIGNKPITVYKWRTMEDGHVKESWMHKKFGIGPKESLVSKFLRMGPDELPQMINVLKGELKIVGLRALDVDEHNALPEDLREARANHAALVNPAYAEKLPTKDKKSEQYQRFMHTSERRFLNDYTKSPFWTKFNIASKVMWRMGNFSFFGL